MANIAVSHTAARGSIPRIGITFFDHVILSWATKLQRSLFFFDEVVDMNGIA